MADFSYQSDVAPYAGTLFKQIQSNPFLTSARSTALSNKLLDTVDAARKREMDFEKDSLSTELARTRLASDRIALDDAREELRLKREATAKAPVVDAEFDLILDDPALDQKTKKASIARWAVKNSDAITRSPILANKYRAALTAAEPDTKDPVSASLYYRMGRDVKIDEKAAAKEAADAAEKARKEQQKKLEKMASRFDTVLSSVDTTDVDEETGEKIAPRFKNQLRDRYRILDLIPLQSRPDAEKLSDVDLVKLAYKHKRSLAAQPTTAEPESKAKSLFGLK